MKKEKGSEEMPKGTKGPTDAKSVYVKFSKPADVQLYEKLSKAAEADERDLGTFILLLLRGATLE